MTFSVLRALHGIIGDALDEIEAVYALHGPQDKRSMANDESAGCSPCTSAAKPDHRPAPSINSLSNIYASPPPSPCVKTEYFSGPASQLAPDFPSLDAPVDPSSLSEALTQHPDVVAAINRIIAACGQMSATVQTPFLTLCDAIMHYHLPSCMRLFEASHTPEILREAGPSGLHVNAISEKAGVDKTKLAHILRLLATHHIVRELSPDVFTLNRVSSTIDTGKNFHDLQNWTAEGIPEKKYEDTSGVAAFVGLCSDEVFKSSAYLTETYLLSSSKATKAASEPTRAPFCFAFGTVESRTGFFRWLEGPAESNPPNHLNAIEDIRIQTGRGGSSVDPMNPGPALAPDNPNPNRFRLERFGKAMSGTCSWETPGAILNSFDWHMLPRNSVVVDVGGGIGSTSMLLASAFASTDDDSLGLRFIVQDRPAAVEMGEKAWKVKCPEYLENGTVLFQAHDFFNPQPVKQAAVFLLRVVLHDWPDDFARRILLQLREAAMPDTKLLLGDFILPLACPDVSGEDGLLDGIQGAESTLASPPLLPNLGKASANAYWMDLTMQVMFNAHERTLREIVTLASSAGWKVIRVTKCPSSLFGYIVAVPIAIPSQPGCRSPGSASCHDPTPTAHQPQEPLAAVTTNSRARDMHDERDMIERSSSRCGTPTFGSRMRLSFVGEALSRFGGGVIRSRKLGTATRTAVPSKPNPLKQAITLMPVPPVKKKRPSPLSLPTSTSPITKGVSSPKQPVQPPGQKGILSRKSLTNLVVSPVSNEAPPLPSPRSPLTPASPRQALPRHSSLAQLSLQRGYQPAVPGQTSPSLIPIRQGLEPTSPSALRGSHGLSGSSSGTASPSPSFTTTSSPPQELPNRLVARRSSLAQLQLQSSPTQKVVPPSPLQGLRKRTKSLAGLSMRARQHAASAVAFVNQTGLLGRGGGGALGPERERDFSESGASSEFPPLGSVSVDGPIDDHRDREEQGGTNSEYGPIDVLAAAAMIEKDIFRGGST